jgi:hypothetical protein
MVWAYQFSVYCCFISDSTKTPELKQDDLSTKKRRFRLNESDDENESRVDEESRTEVEQTRASDDEKESEINRERPSASDDDDDDDDVPLANLKKVRHLEDSDDEREDNLRDKEKRTDTDATTRGNEISTKRPRLTDLSDDDDDDDDVPLVHHKKIRKVILQDDEED